MGKRSDKPRRPQDKYFTPLQGVLPLLPFLQDKTIFAEPCAGDGRLIEHLKRFGHECYYACDIAPEEGYYDPMDWGTVIRQIDARNMTVPDGVQMIITNPPWSRDILHDLIAYLPTVRPTWLLFDADWPHTRQASQLVKTCSKIVSIGRLKWIEGSKSVGKDNCCWYLFPGGGYKNGPHFYGR